MYILFSLFCYISNVAVFVRLIFPFALPTVRSVAHGAMIGGLRQQSYIIYLR